jgi:hypothetical protein
MLLESPTRSEPTANPPSIDDVRRRAYAIFCSRNPWAGNAVQDWLDAERELRCRMVKTEAPPANLDQAQIIDLATLDARPATAQGRMIPRRERRRPRR